ncbi:hypothetical protein VNO78_03754 [Psophocarpus tetragonolobus]|uniref:Uncharacterized protein n=1 Tax=Psophocarpus tetragonolobus TaxID=3891 RepID=A0AAN9TDU6_PSOTE
MSLKGGFKEVDRNSAKGNGADKNLIIGPIVINTPLEIEVREYGREIGILKWMRMDDDNNSMHVGTSEMCRVSKSNKASSVDAELDMDRWMNNLVCTHGEGCHRLREMEMYKVPHMFQEGDHVEVVGGRTET